MAHGLTGHRRRAGVRLVTQWLSQYGRVVVFDQRGHGESGGTCTLAFREPMDLDVVCTWARTLSDAPIVTVGFSLGASVALRHAALVTAPERATSVDAGIQVRERPAATVLVSGVGEWFYRGSHIMDRLFRFTSTPWGRLAMRVGEKVRVSVSDWGHGPGSPDHELPTSPVASASLVKHPLLIIHGDRDHYFPAEHAERVARAAREGGNEAVDIWIEEGMGHAERGTTQELVARLAEWATGYVRR